MGALYEKVGNQLVPVMGGGGNVVDGLNSSSSTSSLSARQGKILNETKKTVHDATLATYEQVFAAAGEGDVIIIDDIAAPLPTNVVVTTSDNFDEVSEQVNEGDFVVVEDENSTETIDDRLLALETTIGDETDLPDPTKSVIENVGEINTNLVANNQNFRFGYDSTSEKYGYILKEADTDVFVPFSQGFNPTVFARQQRNANGPHTVNIAVTEGKYIAIYGGGVLNGSVTLTLTCDVVGAEETVLLSGQQSGGGGTGFCFVKMFNVPSNGNIIAYSSVSSRATFEFLVLKY